MKSSSGQLMGERLRTTVREQHVPFSHQVRRLGQLAGHALREPPYEVTVMRMIRPCTGCGAYVVLREYECDPDDVSVIHQRAWPYLGRTHACTTR